MTEPRTDTNIQEATEVIVTRDLSTSPPSNFLRKRLKRCSSKGFSLVELIIVIAIIAIIAAALAPSLIKYIEKSKLARANKNADAVYTWTVEYIAECGERGNNLDLKSFHQTTIKPYDGTEIAYDGTQTDFFNYLYKCFDTNKQPYVVVKLTEDGTSLLSATWAAKKSDDMVGASPTPATGRGTYNPAYNRYDPKTS